MPRRSNPITLQPPLGGIVRRHAVQWQAPFTTIDALNVLGSDNSAADNSRARIATRPGLTSASISLGTPYNWAPCNFLSGGTLYSGIIVTHSGGSRILYTDSSGVVQTFGGGDIITTDPGTDFTTSCAFMAKPYQAAAGADLRAGNFASAGAGTAQTNAPSGCGLVVAHGTRLVLAGDPTAPFAAYFSRVGGDSTTPGDLNTTDAWDTDATDVDAAASLAGSQGGQLSEHVTSLISHTADCLIIGMTHSMEVLRGSPKRGSFQVLSHEVGPLMQSAWCHAGSNLWFLTTDGLYMMPGGCGDFPQSISREKLPNELVAINPGITGTYASVSYDPRFRCLWIYVDRDGSGSDVFWSYDLQAKGGAWFKHTFTNGPLRLGATLKSAATEDKSALLAINASGTTYQYDQDSTESFNAHVFYGPISPGSEGYEGRLDRIQAMVAALSDDIKWEVYSGDSAEAAYAGGAGTPKYIGSDLTRAGLSTWRPCRVRGAFLYIKFYTTGTKRWALEGIAAKLTELGMRRATGTT